MGATTFYGSYRASKPKETSLFWTLGGRFFPCHPAGEVVGRICAAENKPFNAFHKRKQPEFYYFDCFDEIEIAKALFMAVSDWAHARGLDTIIGPKGLSPFDGYGILVEGFQHRQMMTMMSYNYDYYPKLIEALGFEKEVDFVCCYLPAEFFRLPERVERIAKRVKERGSLKVKEFKSKQELLRWAPRIGEAYNQTFINNWEYYPFSPGDVQFAVDNVFLVADYRLIKVITHGDDIVGFLFAFPDVSAAFQRARCHLFPFGLLDLLLETKRTRTVAGNGMGILPEYQGMGGNALLYYEMGRSVLGFNQFSQVEMTQVAETALK